MTRIKWGFLIFMRYYRSLGLRVSLYAALSVVIALSGPGLRVLVPDNLSDIVSFSDVLPVLTILASSMLAVSTFSLNIMVTAHQNAAAVTTPRVHRLLLANMTTQSVLATFIGAFVYSFIGIILIRVGFYSEEAAVVLMGLTIAVVMLVILAMLRWIEHLKDLGSVENSIDTVRDRTRTVLKNEAAFPHGGGQPYDDEDEIPDAAIALKSEKSGYVQLIDIDSLPEIVEEGGQVWLTVRPGDHVLENQPIAFVTKLKDEECSINEYVTLGGHRTFEEDASFGLTVLSEIASKALSPGLNDPGTAIAVIHTLTMLLWRFGLEVEASDGDDATETPVFVPRRRAAGLIDAAFMAIRRDGADLSEVQDGLQTALIALEQSECQELAAAAKNFGRQPAQNSAA